AVVPGYERAELNAELKVVPSKTAEKSPDKQVEAAKRAAGESGLAREAGPETTVLTGGRREVLDATMKVVEASLDAGAHAVEVRVEAQGEAPSFEGR
ncbi:MAG: thiamine-binding protein, partial [Rubrobacter sp.]